MTSLIGPPLLPDELESVARLKIRSGSTEMTRRALRLIGDGITIALVDDSINEEVEATLSFTADMATQAELDAHTGDTTDAHDASAISFAATGTIAATDAQAAIAEVATEAAADLDARIRAPGTSLPASPADGQLFYDTDDDRLNVYNGTGWVCITPISATEAAGSGLVSNTTYASHNSPAVTVRTGTVALVTISTRCVHNSNNIFVGCAVSGATTLAASDTLAISGLNGDDSTLSMTYRLTGLTAGDNVFTVQERCTANNYQVTHRHLVVVGVP